ncbi:MAG: 50S ribosomal protein L24 [Candidatus Wildermuthbacteria bacterium]|nr:50S ribosomal protein L24 [Candidatus Wildermuthbacteria bacterium]
MKIKKGDTVLILAGKERGKKGKVIKILPGREGVIVEGINARKKHVRPKRAGEKGQIVALPAPLHVSNVKLICPKCGKPVRVGYKLEGEKKYRICKECSGEIV